MKTILALLILFWTLAMPVLAELTPEDLDKIRLIVKEEVKKEITPLMTDINTLKMEGAIRQTEIKNLKEVMNNGFNNVHKDLDNVQNNFDRQNNIIIACIGIPLAILAVGTTVWGILAHRRSSKEQTLENQIETLTEEIETLKQRHIVRP